MGREMSEVRWVGCFDGRTLEIRGWFLTSMVPFWRTLTTVPLLSGLNNNNKKKQMLANPEPFDRHKT